MATPITVASVVTNPGGTGSNIVPTLPSHQADDVIEIFVGKTGNVAWSAPAGWTIKHQSIVGASSNGTVGTLLYRRVLSTDTLPLPNPTCNLGATVTRGAIAITKRGVDIENVYNSASWGATTTTTGTANPIRPFSVVTPAPEMLVHHYYCQRTATNAPEPTGYTEDQQIIISGTLVLNVSEKDVADQQTTLNNQDASPTGGARWVGMISCAPSSDYPYYRAGSQATTASGTSVTPIKPTGTTDSDAHGNADVMIITVEGSGSTTLAMADSGLWTEVGGAWSGTTSGGGSSVKKFWCYATASPNMQATRTGTGEISACVTTYYNCDQSNPIGVFDADARASSSTPAFDAITRGSTKSTVTATCVADGTPTFAFPGGWTERMDGLGIACGDQTYNATGDSASGMIGLSAASPTLLGLLEIIGIASIAPPGDLVVQNSSHSHAAANTTLTQAHTLLVANAAHSHTAENLGLTTASDLVIQNAVHSHTAANVTLTQTHVLAVQGASHSHSAESLALTQVQVLAVDSTSQGHTATSLQLTQVHSLAVQSGVHAHSAENLSITEAQNLVIQNAAHGHTAGVPTLTQVHELVIASSSHTQTAGNLAFTQIHSLTAQSSTHAHPATSLTLTQVHELVTADSSHAHSAQPLALTQDHNLVVESASHAHSAETVAISTESSLGVQSATHALLSENLVLTQAHAITIADSSHTHTAENVAVAVDLVIQSTAHTHSTESLVLTGTHILTVADATHGHTSGGLSLTQDHQLVAQNSSHEHLAESLTLTQIHQLAIENSAHFHSAEVLTFTQVHALTTQSTSHGHASENLELGIPGAQNLNIQSAVHSHSAEVLALTQVHDLVVSNAAHGHIAQNLGLGNENSLLIDASFHAHTARNISFAWTLPADVYEVPAESRVFVVLAEERIFQV